MQAVLWLAQQHHDHFPALSVTGWSQAFHRFRPDLWEDADGISLDYEDLALFTQRLADSSLVPDLDPPISCEMRATWLRSWSTCAWWRLISAPNWKPAPWPETYS